MVGLPRLGTTQIRPFWSAEAHLDNPLRGYLRHSCGIIGSAWAVPGRFWIRMTRRRPGRRHCHACRVETPYVQQSHTAVVVVSISVIAFLAGELAQAFRLRRGVAQVSALGEVLFRVLFFVSLLLLRLGASVAPGAVVPGGLGAF